MKILSVNLGNFGSTGTIMREISHKAALAGNICYNAYPWNPNNKSRQENDIIIGSKFSKKVAVKLSRLTGYLDMFAYFATLNFIRKIKKIKPDIIHLHNLHNSYLNLKLFFNYIKKSKTKIVWTLHDCWAFTGRCPHFEMTECNKWLKGCGSCIYSKSDYPHANHDRTGKLWKLKKSWFTGVENMTIVTPSNWLAGLVKQSFLKDYPVLVINNGIDLEIFKPTQSDFREKYNIPADKKILLGVAFDWGKRKGLDVFIELNRKFNQEKYRIVLVGTDEDTDKQLSENIISIHRTQNQNELAEIYTAADLFVNPTREDNYPTVNMEAIACGTPVITFKTGGSPEIIGNKCGCVVDKDDISSMISGITEICESDNYLKDTCLEKAQQFDKDKKYQEYLDLYNNI